MIAIGRVVLAAGIGVNQWNLRYKDLFLIVDVRVHAYHEDDHATEN
jgi:hypothetical protein